MEIVVSVQKKLLFAVFHEGSHSEPSDVFLLDKGVVDEGNVQYFNLITFDRSVSL